MKNPANINTSPLGKDALRKSLILLLAVVFAAGLSVPPISIANAENGYMESPFSELQVPDASETAQPPQVADNAAAPDQEVGDCTATLEYWENVPYDDPENPPNGDGRRLMGTRVLTGLHEGQVLNTWDYVVNIPGYFFWDAWPATLTISTDPSQNVISLFYFKRWDSEYTVNYYVMTGANLAADNWVDALQPNNVKFTKIASETFDSQQFDSIINGDAYEYKVDGMYVIDTYPTKIQLGTDPDNNVLNVLYTPTSTTLPDHIEVPDDVVDDSVGSNPDTDGGKVDITDDMLANPIPPEQAAAVKSAYLKSLSMPQTGDNTPVVAGITVAVMALAIAVMALLFGRRSHREQ